MDVEGVKENDKTDRYRLEAARTRKCSRVRRERKCHRGWRGIKSKERKSERSIILLDMIAFLPLSLVILPLFPHHALPALTGYGGATRGIQVISYAHFVNGLIQYGRHPPPQALLSFRGWH